MKKIDKPFCFKCERGSRLVGGDVIYPHRPDLKHKKFYQCAVCGDYVGCHPDSTQPLGTLADKRTMRVRQEAHKLIDPFWQSKRMTRSDVYYKLTEELGIERDKCHIGMFDYETCQKVKQIAMDWIGQINSNEA